jgi:hypothetical protein
MYDIKYFLEIVKERNIIDEKISKEQDEQIIRELIKSRFEVNDKIRKLLIYNYENDINKLK